MKKIFGVVILLLIVGIFIRRGWRKNDFRMGIVGPEEVAMLSISPERGMVNLVKVDSEVLLWLPGGRGWYPSNKMKKIAKNDKENLMDRMFYYNFGFRPEKIAYVENIEEWRNWTLIKYIGIVDWLRFKFQEENWLYKEESIKRSLLADKELLDEVLPRDLADSELLRGELKMTVINASGENGLGSFSADRLNWMGFNVVGVESETAKENCELVVSTLANELTKKYADILDDIYECSRISNNTILSNELLLYLGQNYASMIKYDSYNYVRTF